MISSARSLNVYNDYCLKMFLTHFQRITCSKDPKATPPPPQKKKKKKLRKHEGKMRQTDRRTIETDFARQ